MNQETEQGGKEMEQAMAIAKWFAETFGGEVNVNEYRTAQVNEFSISETDQINQYIEVIIEMPDGSNFVFDGFDCEWGSVGWYEKGRDIHDDPDSSLKMIPSDLLRWAVDNVRKDSQS